MYFLYLYFLGLSLRNTSRVLEPFKTENRVMCLSGIGYKIRFIADLQKKKNIHIRYR